MNKKKPSEKSEGKEKLEKPSKTGSRGRKPKSKHLSNENLLEKQPQPHLPPDSQFFHSSSEEENAIYAEARLPATIHEIMIALKEDSRGVWVARLVRKITKTGDQALVLSQIMYWFDHDRNNRPRARVMRAGKRWMYKTHAEMARETGMKPRQAGACLKWLCEQGMIEVQYWMADGKRTTHIRPIQAEIFKQLKVADADRFDDFDEI